MNNHNKSERIKRQMGYIAAAFWACFLLVVSFAIVLSDFEEFTLKILSVLTVIGFPVLVTFYYARIHSYWCKKIDKKYSDSE